MGACLYDTMRYQDFKTFKTALSDLCTMSNGAVNRLKNAITQVETDKKKRAAGIDSSPAPTKKRKTSAVQPTVFDFARDSSTPVRSFNVDLDSGHAAGLEILFDAPMVSTGRKPLLLRFHESSAMFKPDGKAAPTV